MINKKHLFYPTLFAVLSCGGLALGLHAQDAGAPPPERHRPPPSPLFDALDTNHDGTISADEIANASTALKALLKNGATQLTREDLRPPRPVGDRDERDRPQRRPGPEAMRSHRPPPRDDQDADDSAPPRPREDEERRDRPHHGPPPPRSPEDEREMDDDARPQPPHADRDDRDDRPPRPMRDEYSSADDHSHSRRRMDDREERRGHRPPPPSPLFDALDTNHDGIISADEIAAAPESLKKLDKSGSGQIKREDLKLPPPPREND